MNLRLAALATTLTIVLIPARTVMAQRTLSDGISDLAAQISTSVAQQHKAKVAVVPFRELDGRATVLGTYLAEALVTDLFKRGGLDIVERTMLDRILGELKLGQSGLLDPGTAKQVGQLAGVDAIVTGTITDLQSFVAINCRLIDVQSGRVFGAADAKIVKDDDVRRIMGVEMGQVAGMAQSSGSAESPASSRSIEWSDAALRLQVLGMDMTRAGTRLTILVTNLTSRYGSARFHAENPNYPDQWGHYLVDDLGNRYPTITASVLRGGQATVDIELVPNLPVRVQLQFGATAPDARAVTLVLSDGFGYLPSGGGPRKIRLGPIPLTHRGS